MKKTGWIAVILSLALTLSGCGNNGTTEETGSAVSSTGAETAAETSADSSASTTVEGALSAEDLFTDRDYREEYDESGAALITLSGDTASCDSNAVQIDGSTVTITDEGTYILSGTLTDGMILVNADKSDKLQLVLNGVSVTSSTSAALYILQADKVFLTTAAGTENTLANGGTFTAIDENNIDAAIFSREDLTLNGQGSLTVESPAGHGVVSKDDLVVTGGAYVISSASHGLSGKDSIRVAGGTFTITAGKDGLHAENSDDAELGYVYILDGSFTITAEGDGVSAGSILQVDGGDFTILAGGGSANGSKSSSDSYGYFRGGRGQFPQSTEDSSSEDSTSMKGLKAGTTLLLTGGTFTIDSADDGIHSNGSATVTGGAYEIATGDDGFHADDTLTVSGGTIQITESYEGLEALTLTISGGDISVVSTDDGLNAAGGTDSSGFGGRDSKFGGGWGSSSSDGSIVISGGNIYIQASGDGIDSNGSLTVCGGYLVVCGPTQGDTATLDYDTTAAITGGTFIGTGASSMAQTFSSSEQGVISVTMSAQSAGTSVVLKDTAGNVILEYEPALDFAVVILSSGELEKGGTYSLTVGSVTEEVTAS